MNDAEQMQGQLWTILFITAALGIFMILVSLFYFKSWPMFWGICGGSVLAIANFIFLIKIVVKLLDRNYTRKPIIGLFFLLKLTFIAVILGLSFWVFAVKVNKLAFVMGYLCLIIAITLVSLMRKMGPQPN